MKKIIVFMLPLLSLWACDGDKIQHPDDCSVELAMIEMRTNGDLPQNPAPLSGNTLPWQESIYLRDDNTFIKHHERNGVITEEAGAYEYTTIGEESFLELIYNTPDNKIIESCTTMEQKEVIRIMSAARLEGTWGACDGPTLVYQKTSVNCAD